MLHWIFDLDYTLYNLDKTEEFSYEKIFEDKNLKTLIGDLPAKKLIFTNGTYIHALRCLRKMNIYNDFDKIIARDSIKSLKPNKLAYIKFMFVCDIDMTDKCVFFDDNINNLKSAKDLKWITVLIGKKFSNIDFIDFVFPDIYSALQFFKKVSKID